MNSNGVYEYPKVKALHYLTGDLQPATRVIVQEKWDGSNVAFRREDDRLVLQSRTTIIDETKPGQFAPFVAWVNQNRQRLLDELVPGDIIFGEMVSNQGKIKYAGTSPFLLFDRGYLMPAAPHPHTPVDSFDAVYYPYDQNILELMARRIGAGYVGNWWAGEWQDCPLDALTARLTAEGANHEGFVVKAYNVFIPWRNPETGETGGRFHPILAGKVVRADYAEMKTGKTSIKRVDDPLAEIAARFVTPARVRKAVQRAIEEEADHTKGDQIIRRVVTDVRTEEETAIKDLLYQVYWGKAGREIAKLVLAELPAVLDETRIAA